MEVTIIERTLWGWDWAVVAAGVAATGSLLAAAATFLLWHTARGELRALLDAASESASGRTEELQQLKAQAATARDQLHLATQPFVIAHRPSERQARDHWDIENASQCRVNVDGQHVLVTVRNAGRGVARHVVVRAAVIHLGDLDAVRSLSTLGRPADFETREVDILTPGEEQLLRWLPVRSAWSVHPPYGLLCETRCYDESGTSQVRLTAFAAERIP